MKGKKYDKAEKTTKLFKRHVGFLMKNAKMNQFCSFPTYK